MKRNTTAPSSARQKRTVKPPLKPEERTDSTKGRKPKMGDDLFGEVEKYVKAGNYTNVAIECAGISSSAFYAWLKERPDFQDRLKAAESHAEVRAVTVLATAGLKDWRAALAFLERKFPERWRRVTKLAFDEIPDDQVLRILALMGVNASTDDK